MSQILVGVNIFSQLQFSSLLRSPRLLNKIVAYFPKILLGLKPHLFLRPSFAMVKKFTFYLMFTEKTLKKTDHSVKSTAATMLSHVEYD